jgi:hypothetical protein
MPARKTTRKSTSKKSKSARGRSAGKKAAKQGAVTGIGQKPPLGFMLIDMIPQSLSGETAQDSEPHLTVNPANPKMIIGTAFSPNPGGGALGPVYKSLDAGNTWTVNAIVPSQAGSGLGTGDITTSFNRTGTKLYGGILRAGTGALEFLRTNVPAFPPMTVLKSRPSADQPFTHATTVPAGGVGAGQDRVYIGDNDFAAPGGKTQTVDQSLNAAVGPPTAFNSVRVEKRTTVGQDGPQCRPVAHSDGTVYAAFYGWRALTGSFPANTLVITNADVVVVRDDKWGAGGFIDLKEPPAPAGDGLAGKRVVKGVSFPFMIHGTAATGQQRIGGTISIAVDPNNSKVVYLAWGDRQHGSFLSIHVRRSTDRGVTWSGPGDLLTIPNATNAALAINSAGVIGLLYQQVTGTGASQRWVTHLQRSPNGVLWSDLVLATVPATTPVKTFDPYIGDYAHLVAVGQRFYGIFSANNTPNLANFPNGVKYQRNANFTTHTLLNVNNSSPVAVSIDPFFVTV